RGWSLLIQSRRRFLTNAAFAGAAGLVRVPPSLAAEGPLETTTVRIGKSAAICLAPLDITEELLRAEEFTLIRFVEQPAGLPGQLIGRDEADFEGSEPTQTIRAIADGMPIVVLTGVHGGCYELFAQQDFHRVGELKGKRIVADNPWLFDLI